MSVHGDGHTSGSNPICIPVFNRSANKRSKRQVGENAILLKDYDELYSSKVSRDQTSTTPSTQINNGGNTTVNKTSDDGEVITSKVPSKVPTEKNPVNNNTQSPDNKVEENTPYPVITNQTRFIPKYAELVGTRKYVPCAICQAKQRSAKLMIPLQTTCPTSWHTEYQGYMMTYHHNTKQSEIICVYDQALGVSPSSDAGIRKIISKYMSHIKVDCTTFPCPPYSEELLKCVVCSK